MTFLNLAAPRWRTTVIYCLLCASSTRVPPRAPAWMRFSKDAIYEGSSRKLRGVRWSHRPAAPLLPAGVCGVRSGRGVARVRALATALWEACGADHPSCSVPLIAALLEGLTGPWLRPTSLPSTPRINTFILANEKERESEQASIA